MIINGVKEIVPKGNSIDVILEISLDSNRANRWEISEPVILVNYRSTNELNVDYMALLDNGMKIHGYDISSEEENKIISYLSKNNIKEKIKNYL